MFLLQGEKSQTTCFKVFSTHLQVFMKTYSVTSTSAVVIQECIEGRKDFVWLAKNQNSHVLWNKILGWQEHDKSRL